MGWVKVRSVEMLKARLKANQAFQTVWRYYRRCQLHRSYRKRREYYTLLATERGIVYREAEVIASIRSRIQARGYIPTQRRMGEVHTFACIPQFSWHKHLLPDLNELGKVSLFDYVSLGFKPKEFYGNPKWDQMRISRREQMVKQMFSAFREAHLKHPVDWVLCYGGGQDISATVIRRITEEFGVPTVNMTFDDKHGWTGPNTGEHCTGARDITSVFDLFITSARVTCEWHMVEGGRPIYMPEGFDNSYYRPRDVNKDIPVSFVGVAYGFRKSVIRYLRKYGIPVQTFGEGWPTGHVEDIVDIFNRSIINLGMGGIGYSESLTNVKGRDFDIPGTGGGVYLTSFNPDLAQHFIVGEEILCYRNRDEMLELIRYYLAHPEEAREIAHRGRERCLREHRWLHRYQRALEILGVFQ